MTSENLDSNFSFENENIEDEQANSQKEIEKLNDARLKCIGETSILRAALIKSEKENFRFRNDLSRNYVMTLDRATLLKKEINLLKMENKIRENQLKRYKRHKNCEIENSFENDYVYIFSEISGGDFFSIYPFEYKRLRILNNFFSQDFDRISISNQEAITSELNKRVMDGRTFYKLFKLFMGCKPIFFNFFPLIIQIASLEERDPYCDLVLKAFKYIDVSWIIEMVKIENWEFYYKRFVSKYITVDSTILFFVRLCIDRPFLLNDFLAFKDFNEICMVDSIYSRKLCMLICENKLKDFLNEKNILYFRKSMLRHLFREESYQDFLFK